MRATFFLTPWQELRELENTRVGLPGVFFCAGILGAQADVGCGDRCRSTGETLLDPVRCLAPRIDGCGNFRLRADGISVGEKDAIERLARCGNDFRKQSGRGQKHRMAATIEVNL